MRIYPWKVNHHSAIVNLSWHPSVFGVWHRCLPHFFDLRKAFDSVSHLPVLNKLKDMSFNGWYLIWVTGSTMSLMAVQLLKQVQCCQGYHKDLFLALCYFWSTSTVCAWCHYLRDQWFQCIYADDILLCKRIHHPENYDDLQRETLIPSINA